MTERLHFHFSLSCIGEGNGNPLQCSCLENPRDGGAWWAAVYRVAQSRTRLKRLSSSSSSSSKASLQCVGDLWPKSGSFPPPWAAGLCFSASPPYPQGLSADRRRKCCLRRRLLLEWEERLSHLWTDQFACLKRLVYLLLNRIRIRGKYLVVFIPFFLGGGSIPFSILIWLNESILDVGESYQLYKIFRFSGFRFSLTSEKIFQKSLRHVLFFPWMFLRIHQWTHLSRPACFLPSFLPFFLSFYSLPSLMNSVF